MSNKTTNNNETVVNVNMNTYAKLPFETVYSNWYNEQVNNVHDTQADKHFSAWLAANKPEVLKMIKPYLDDFNNKKLSAKLADTYICAYLAKIGLINDSFQPVVKINFNGFKFSNESMTLKQAISQLAAYKNTLTASNKPAKKGKSDK